MPHYSYEYTFAANGSKEEQEELEMPCTWGILTDIAISFRTGTDRLCHVHIDETIHQIFPTNAEETYAFDGYTLLITDEYELLKDTRKIYLRGWNEGTHPHTVAVSFRIKMPERLSKTEELLTEMNKLWRRLTGG